ncbi:MAG: ParA family protein, partial [Gammaproteobacteria bacterium]|nr:ParA family protein [Gammaproteobacteria bacterium]
MRMIAVINQKGGVGKTTTTLNLSHALAKFEKKVLVIDLDPQAHLTAGYGVLQRDQRGIADVLLGEADLNDVIEDVRENVSIVPAGSRLGELEHLTEGGAKRGFLLKEAIKNNTKLYDYILVDCPPSSGILGMNALLAAEEVLVPVSGDFFALQGLSRLMSIFQHIENTLKRKTKKWVVLTRFHDRRKLAREVKGKILSYFPDSVFQTAIRETVALAESPGFGQTIFEYQPKCNGANDYMELAADV